jgi:hypothetical protein
MMLISGPNLGFLYSEMMNSLKFWSISTICP